MIDLSSLGARPVTPTPSRPPPLPLPPTQAFSSQRPRASEDQTDPFYRLNFNSELYGDAFPQTLLNLAELREAEARAARAQAAASADTSATIVQSRGWRLRRKLLMGW